MFGKRVTLFELLGFRVQVDASWLVIATLVTWSLATGYFPFVAPGLPTATYWWMAAVGMIGLFASIIFHELSHSVVARRFNLPIRGITLFLFGGVAEMTREPPSPRAEFFMAIAGPIASLVAGAAFYVLGAFGETAGTPAAAVAVAHYLATINVILAAFNMIPAFPLDGGRALRAVLWHRLRDLARATRLASQLGQWAGLGLIALGLLQIVTGNFVGGLWLGLIGLFLRGAAAATYQQVLAGKALEARRVGDLMARHPVTVPPSLTLAEFVEDYVYAHHHAMFPVVSDGRLLGAVWANALRTVPRAEWPRRRVLDLMVPAGPDNTLSPHMEAAAALAKIRQYNATRFLVAEGDRLVGVIVLRDFMDFITLKTSLEEAE